MTENREKVDISQYSKTNFVSKVLIVDDKAENLLLLETILSDLNVVSIKANSGNEVLTLMLKHQFVVVLLDVKMPGMSGVETAKLMQDNTKTMNTPVIFVTGNDADEIEQIEGYQAGVIDHIIKPVNADILKSKVKMFLTLFMQANELQDKYNETATLEDILKQKNRALEKYNKTLEYADLERQHQYAQTRALLAMNPDGILVIDKDKRILFTNPSAAHLLNRFENDLLGETFSFPMADEENTEIIIGDEIIAEMREVNIDWNGESSFLISLRDITILKQTEAKLYKLAQYDQLTGLANRRHCLDYLIKALARARRHKGYLAILFIDLDKFKDINDSFGHDVGDELLISVANRLNTCVREGDLAARFGGDEFALILDEVKEPEDAGIIAQKIIDAMEEPLQLKNQPITVECSIGIATFPQCGNETDDLFKAADLAMFYAKSQGRNNFQFFEKEMQQQLDQRIRLEHDLRYANEKQELELHYQAQIDVSTGKIVAMEALLRWQHGKDGMISPAKFIPIAEKTGLIIGIGEWVIQTACTQVNTWNDTDFMKQHGLSQPLTIAVNVSSEQFSHGDFRERLARVLEDTQFDPYNLEVELTESIMMNDPDTTAADLAKISKEGIGVSIDDFGTGYSSLSYLQYLSLTSLKIDQSFVAEVGKDLQSEVIIKTIISMAHNLNLLVIAEGVATVGIIKNSNEQLYIQSYK